MGTFEVMIARLAPDDPDVERILDLYEAGTKTAPYQVRRTGRCYLIEAESQHQASDIVAADLRRLAGEQWPEHLTLARGDDPY